MNERASRARQRAAGCSVEKWAYSWALPIIRAGREWKVRAGHFFVASKDSVRLKNGMTCSWKRTATSLVWVPG